MDQQTDQSSKTHEATQHKLNEARKKGELARSADLNTAASYAGFLAVALIGGAASIDSLGTTMMVMLDQSVPLSKYLADGSGESYLGELLKDLSSSLMTWFLIPAGFVLLSAFSQRSIVFASSKLTPKLSRISLVQNVKNKYGPSGLFEFFKSFLKLLCFSVTLVAYLMFRIPEITGIVNASPMVAATLFAQVLIEFFLIVVIVSALIGVLDYAWQYYDHLKRNRMTYKEIKDENKEQEGDPYLKQERRQRGTRIAQQQIAASVSTADVVIVNPTHYAVVLKWSREPGTAPQCVAKGVDHMAQAIKELAINHSVPIKSDPPTARALFATTDVGQEVDQRHYHAVAAAIRFAENIRKKAAYWS